MSQAEVLSLTISFSGCHCFILANLLTVEQIISVDSYETQRQTLLNTYLERYGLGFSRHKQYQEFRQKIWVMRVVSMQQV